MKRFREFCTKIKIVAVEVLGLTVFLVVLYVVGSYEITHLLR